MKSKLAAIALLLGSSVFALLLCELGCRVFLNPVDSFAGSGSGQNTACRPDAT